MLNGECWQERGGERVGEQKREHEEADGGKGVRGVEAQRSVQFRASVLSPRKGWME